MQENTLTGQVVDGKVVLDPFNVMTDETVTSGSPAPTDSRQPYLAVNAPFDPESVEIEKDAEMEPVEA